MQNKINFTQWNRILFIFKLLKELIKILFFFLLTCIILELIYLKIKINLKDDIVYILLIFSNHYIRYKIRKFMNKLNKNFSPNIEDFSIIVTNLPSILLFDLEKKIYNTFKNLNVNNGIDYSIK